jgi:hypothetical protein
MLRGHGVVARERIDIGEMRGGEVVELLAHDRLALWKRG